MSKISVKSVFSYLGTIKLPFQKSKSQLANIDYLKITKLLFFHKLPI